MDRPAIKCISPIQTLNIILFVVFAVCLSACQPKSEPHLDSTQNAMTTTSSNTVIALIANDVSDIRYGTLTQTIPFTGTIQSTQKTTLQSQNHATIIHINAEVGQYVKKGQLLLQLNNPDDQARLNQAQAQLAAAKIQANLSHSVAQRKQQLFNQGFIAKLEYEQALTESQAQQENIQALNANIAIAKKAAQDSQIYSPISGYITQRWVDVGQTVNIGQNVLEIINPNHLEIIGQLSASEQAHLTIGQTLTAQIQGSPNLIRAKVTRISPFAESNSRSIQFFADIQEKSPLSIGAFVEGTLLQQQTTQGQIIPLKSIQSLQQQPFVWVIRQEKLLKIPIKILQQQPQQDLALVTGLDINDKVSLISFHDAQQHQAVRIQKIQNNT